MNNTFDHYEWDDTGPKIDFNNRMKKEKSSSICKEMLRQWKSGINNDEDSNLNQSMDMLYCSMEPRVKWFQPPFTIKIFKLEISMMWAYKIHKAYMLKNCVPISAKTEYSDNKEFTLEFNANNVSNLL